jgi:hypothetical protein
VTANGRGGGDAGAGASYWQAKFGADPGVVGRTIQLNGQPFTVIGVMPERFSGAQWSIGVSGWVPAMAMSRLIENGEGLLNIAVRRRSR